MTAIDRLDAWLRISPSTVLPAEVLEYLDDVKAENAKLREDLDYAIRQVDMLTHNASVGSEKPSPDSTDAITLFKAENTKLRELCADMWRFTSAACKKYPRLFDPAAQGPQMVQLNMIDAFEQRMHELGIEVR